MDTDTTYTTGGDVSRFQRSSVPGKAAQPQQLAGNGAVPGQPGATPATPAMPTSPVVRVARGNAVTITPAGGK